MGSINGGFINWYIIMSLVRNLSVTVTTDLYLTFEGDTIGSDFSVSSTSYGSPF